MKGVGVAAGERVGAVHAPHVAVVIAVVVIVIVRDDGLGSRHQIVEDVHGVVLVLQDSHLEAHGVAEVAGGQGHQVFRVDEIFKALGSTAFHQLLNGMDVDQV